jgi:hypothetical protein
MPWEPESGKWSDEVQLYQPYYEHGMVVKSDHQALEEQRHSYRIHTIAVTEYITGQRNQIDGHKKLRGYLTNMDKLDARMKVSGNTARVRHVS